MTHAGVSLGSEECKIGRMELRTETEKRRRRILGE